MSGKLPAYAKRLIGMRHAGHHPLFIGVWFGDDWREARLRAQGEAIALKICGDRIKPYGPAWVDTVGHPLLAISPRDYQPGSYDLRCVTGSLVELHDGANQAGDYDAPLYALAGELSRWAHVSASFGLGLRSDARRARRLILDRTGEQRWPAWWSDELDKEHVAKFERWKSDASVSIDRARRAA